MRVVRNELPDSTLCLHFCTVTSQGNESCFISPLEKMSKLKAERDLERANAAFASLDSDESGRYYVLFILCIVFVCYLSLYALMEI